MGKLFCIMGKSGSGKDSMFRALLKNKELGLRPVVQYTTRPPRDGERDGFEYRFVGDAELDRLERRGAVLERRRYRTVHGVWQYATVDDGQFSGPGDLLVVTTPEAFVKLRARLGAENAVPLYIEVEDGERLSRLLRRERAQASPDYAEMCRRFLADREDFSDEKLAAAGISRRFENGDFGRCAAELSETVGRKAGGRA